MFIGDHAGGKVGNHHYGCSPERKNVCVHEKTKGKELLNAGVIGGSRKLVLELLSKICNLYKKLGKKAINYNMGILQEVVYNSHIVNKIKIGAPVVSKFKKYENHRKDVWFIHK